MSERRIQVLLLSRDADLADSLSSALEPLGMRVERKAPSSGEERNPPKRAAAGPGLLIVDGRDYLNACLFSEASQASDESPTPPTLLLLSPYDMEALPAPLKADEVTCLPLQPEEVRLRIRNLVGPPVYGLSRGSLDGRPSGGSEIRPADSGLKLDEERYEIALNGQPLNLTFREYELLKYLMSHPGRTFTREHLLARVWGEDYLGGTRTVDVHIRRLRLKVEEGGRDCIRTVRSVGYKFIG